MSAHELDCARSHPGRNARGGGAAQARCCRSSDLEYQAFAIGGGVRDARGAFSDALHEPGHRRDRRVQAPLALGGDAARGAGSARDRGRLRARRRGRAVGADRGAQLRRLARGSARGARRPASCRSCARTSSSTPTSCTRRRSARRRRGAADRGGAGAAGAARGAARAARASSGWTCWWRCTTARSCSVRSALGAELIGINNRDLRDFSVDVERTERLMGEIPAGVTVVSESGIAEPSSWHARGCRRATRCWWGSR